MSKTIEELKTEAARKLLSGLLNKTPIEKNNVSGTAMEDYYYISKEEVKAILNALQK